MDAINELKWHWLLEKVSEGSLGDRWIVWDENRIAIGDDNTPERAIRQAIEKPLTDAQRGYSPRFNVESAADLARLTEENKAYREALLPFAALGKSLTTTAGRTYGVGDFQLYSGDLFRAADTMAYWENPAALVKGEAK